MHNVKQDLLVFLKHFNWVYYAIKGWDLDSNPISIFKLRPLLSCYLIVNREVDNHRTTSRHLQGHSEQELSIDSGGTVNRKYIRSKRGAETRDGGGRGDWERGSWEIDISRIVGVCWTIYSTTIHLREDHRE